MTLSHKKTLTTAFQLAARVGREFRTCRAYSCVLTPPLSSYLHAWSKLDPPQSVAFLCPEPASSDFIYLWREVCHHVLSVLKQAPDVLPLIGRIALWLLTPP